jgi:hypothetical protein
MPERSRGKTSPLEGDLLRRPVGFFDNRRTFKFMPASNEEQLGPDAADQTAHGFALVTAAMVHDDDITGAAGRDQERSI